MPRIFKTMLWLTILVLMVATLCGIFLSPNFDRTVLWVGLAVVLGILIGATVMVLNLNRSVTLFVERRGGTMCHHEFVNLLDEFAADMIGSKKISTCLVGSSSSSSSGSGASHRSSTRR